MRFGALQWLAVAVGAALLVASAWGQPANWETGIAHITTRKDLKRAPGAAFAVAVRNGNAYLVTSAHVVEGDDSPQVEFVAEPEKVYRATVRVIEPGDERGLALLVVANPPAGVRPIPASSLLLGMQAGVSVAGYPSSLNTFSVVDTTVAALRGRDVFLSRETDEGFSGGPVVIAGGVVGIVYRHEAGFGKVLGASSINPFIEGNSLAWGTFGTPKRPPDLTQVAAPPENTAPRPGQTRENPKDKLTYVWIPPGKFTMGCSPEDSECLVYGKPPHEVTITRGFRMGRTEVTVSAYGSFSKLPEGNGISILPVVDVTWDERNPSVSGMRLPTEAEWEYAARAGTTGPRYGALDEIAWHAGNSRRKLHPVGEKQPNQWGLYDMLGNAKEWVADPVGAYQQASAIDPTGPSSDHPFGVVRGGAWSDEPKDVRASWRDIVPDSTGFRCAGELR